MKRRLVQRWKVSYVPVELLGAAHLPGLTAPPDLESKVYRWVRLPRRVESGERLRGMSMGFTGRTIGAVLRQVDLPDGGVAALIALYTGENGPVDPDAEVFVEIVEEPPVKPRSPDPAQPRNIFDFTQGVEE